MFIIEFSAFCVYKSKQYKQGEKWLDGCDFSCECTDVTTGKYVCNERYVVKLIIVSVSFNIFTVIS